jgi:hypothetical protein
MPEEHSADTESIGLKLFGLLGKQACAEELVGLDDSWAIDSIDHGRPWSLPRTIRRGPQSSSVSFPGCAFLVHGPPCFCFLALRSSAPPGRRGPRAHTHTHTHLNAPAMQTNTASMRYVAYNL